jgi:putative transposase
MKTSSNHGNRTSKNHPVVDGIIEQAIAKYYMNQRKVPFMFVVRAVRWMVDDENRYRHNDEQLRQPSYSTVCRRIELFNTYRDTKVRCGKRYANHGIGVFKQGLHTTMPLELVEIDHTKLDLSLIYDDKYLRSEYDSLQGT